MKNVLKKRGEKLKDRTQHFSSKRYAKKKL